MIHYGPVTELPATFGKYFLTEKLATGGMAEIYLGKLVGPGGFEKQLVIKQIHPRLAAEPHFVDLFVAEAKTLVGLTHGNIVPVYELGLVEKTYFIAMEYIDGPTLWQLTESVWRAHESIAPQVASWIAAEILDGLDYAHRKGDGVIHRDLSPRNVMLSRDGQVLLVDFGIAVPFGAGDDPSAEGAPTGSFPYMSPEQVERRRLTAASDLFSLSVLFWEMLAGQRLFARPEAAATLDAVLHGPIPPPSSVRAAVPSKLDEVVLRGLEREPEKRWGSAGELLSAINRYLYALDEPPGAREVAALIARWCPPVRQPTPEVVVPSTTVDDEAHEPVTQSFATHAELQKVFEKTPLFGTRAIPDDAGGSPKTTPHPRRSVPPTSPPPIDPVVEKKKRAQTRAEAREQSSWKPLAAISAVAVLVVGGSLFLLLNPPGASSAAQPGGHDAAVAAIRPDAAPPPPPPPDAAPAPPVDAGAKRPTPDAGARRPRPDAGVKPPPKVDAAAAVEEDGTIKVGADPWGEVYIDDRKVGNAPGTFDVPPGHHQVVVVYPSEDGEKKKTFPVDVKSGKTSSVFADFKE
jgi:serine/threonine protein kinase